MLRQNEILIATGSLMALLAIVLGAFGAHGLRDTLDARMMEVYQTAVQYHMMHATGMILIGLIAERMDSSLLIKSGWLMLIGILLFSGSLYALSVTGTGWLGMITPVGGVCFILAWAGVCWSYLRKK